MSVQRPNENRPDMEYQYTQNNWEHKKETQAEEQTVWAVECRMGVANSVERSFGRERNNETIYTASRPNEAAQTLNSTTELIERHSALSAVSASVWAV